MRRAVIESARRLSAPGILFGARLGAAAIGLATQILLARTLHAPSLGLFFLATSLAAVTAVVAAAGYPQAAARFLTRYGLAARRARYAAFVRCALRDVIVLASLFATLIGLGASLLLDAATAGAILLVVLVVPALAIGHVLGAVAIANRRVLLASVPDFVVVPFGIFLAAAVMAWAGREPNVAILLGVFVVLGLSVALMKALGLRRSGVLPLDARSVRGRTWLWRARALPLAGLALFTALFADVAILASAPFLVRADLAVFAICVKISLLAGFVIQAVHQAALPSIAEDLHRRDYARAMLRVNESNRATVAVTLGLTVAAYFLGDRLLALFDPAFASASAALTLLVAAQVVRAVAGPASQMLTVLGRERVVLVTCPAALLVLVAANALLIPLFGMLGAGLAVLVAISFWSAILASALFAVTKVRSHLDPALELRRAFGRA